MDLGDASERAHGLWDAYSERALPPMTESIKAAEVDVDLYEADAYLAGLADQFATKQRLDVPTIRIKCSIERAVAVQGADASELRSFWRLWLDLAEALSEATGVPIERF